MGNMAFSSMRMVCNRHFHCHDDENLTNGIMTYSPTHSSNSHPNYLFESMYDYNFVENNKKSHGLYLRNN